ALRDNDDAEFDRLLWVPASTPVERLEVVTLGVSKKVSAAFVRFEFRLRTVIPAGAISAGQPLAWSCVFAVKAGSDISPGTYLHLQQKQKFKPIAFLDGTVMVIEQAAVALDGAGGRISLGDASTVTPGEPFTDWQRFAGWDPRPALERLRACRPGP